jgi:hypothetical protein
VAAAVALAAAWEFGRPGPDCRSESEVRAVVLRSPDGQWEADVDRRVCFSWGIATTGIDDVVAIRHSGEPASRGADVQPEDVFYVDAHNQYPLLLWPSPSHLEITVPNESRTAVIRNSYQGIEISVKYDPDNPAETAAFLSRGSDPEPQR